MPLLDFAYTSQLTFNFCVMAEVVMLARHLLMPEVIQMCERVHRKVEEQKLTVYQPGDVHTVVSGEPLNVAGSGTYMVAVEADEQALVAHGDEHITLLADEVGTAQSLALLAGATGNAGTVTVVAHAEQADPDNTMTVVTHSGQAGSSESLAVVRACWTVEEPPPGDASVPPGVEPDTFIISVDPGNDRGEVPAEPPPPPIPTPVKRRPGRPPKVKQAPPPSPPPQTEQKEDNVAGGEEEMKREAERLDPNKRSLRKRSVQEGGYARLHMGIEENEVETMKVRM